MGNIKILNLKEANTLEKISLEKMKMFKRISKMSDEDIENLNRGGHDPIKVLMHTIKLILRKEKPTVILAFTIKGLWSWLKTS